MSRSKNAARYGLIGAAALGATAAVLLVTGLGRGAPGDTWKCTVTGEQGGTHVFNVVGDDQAGAIAACKTAWVNSATYSVVNTTPTTTTSTTSSSTTSTTSSTTSTTTVPPGPGYPALAPPFRLDGGVNSCSLLTSGGWSVNEAGSDHPGTAAIERSQVGEGPCGVKFTTPAGSGTGRAELQMPQLATPVTVDYEFLMYVPSKANGGPDHGYAAQTKMGSNPCSNGGLTIDKSIGGSLAWSIVGSCSAGSTKHNLGLGQTFRDHWFGIRVTSTFSNTGHAKVQYDPDGTGPAGYVTKLDVNADTLSGTGLKLRQGIYHDQDPYLTTVYGDGFRVKCVGAC